MKPSLRRVESRHLRRCGVSRVVNGRRPRRDDFRDGGEDELDGEKRDAPDPETFDGHAPHGPLQAAEVDARESPKLLSIQLPVVIFAQGFLPHPLLQTLSKYFYDVVKVFFFVSRGRQVRVGFSAVHRERGKLRGRRTLD